MTEDHRVLVIGAGQSGLATEYHLQRRGADFLLVDGGAEVGQVWRSRWDSLRLFTPAQYASLPGWPFPAPADTYPSREHVADYLAAYAARFRLPVRLNTPIARLTWADGQFLARSAAGGQCSAQRVVVATGPFARPFVPPLAAGLSTTVGQVHTVAYRQPEQLPSGRVAVVGGGNSGFQIAAELAESGRSVELAIGRQNARVPQRLLGRDLFWWQDRLGLLRVSADARLGQRMRENDGTVIGSTLHGLRRHGVVVRPRVTGAAGRRLTYADGAASDVDGVVWATGFTVDDPGIDIPGVLDGQGRLVQQRGVVGARPGLFTIGRAWQHTTGSALLGFVQHDAAWLAARAV